jgi:hypothetical protein
MKATPKVALCQTFILLTAFCRKEHIMANDQQTQDAKTEAASQPPAQEQAKDAAPNQFDGLKDKKPEELTPEELRLMADTMPGEGPGD